jgi:FKBP-type peptidyl-prolyl cis-trans isomerase FkpA
MYRLIIGALIPLFAVPALLAEEPKSEEQKTLYAIGLRVAGTLSAFDLSPAEFEYVKQGLMDAMSGKKAAVEISAYDGRIQELARTRRKALGDKLAASNQAFLDEAAKEKGAVKTGSGLVYVSLREGTGAKPGPADIVKVNYRGTLISGKEFDSSYKRGTAAEFPLNRVITCWTEGLQMIKAGGKAKLVCPSSLAYGDKGFGDEILPGATLVFEVELLEIKK